ncbi:hypothetical protein J6590_104069 [Homalodisca vitripennis]|nr:hypothetical protein J6590_104069 [Homalodisca vitripennis]
MGVVESTISSVKDPSRSSKSRDRRERGSGVGHRGARGREALSRLPGLAERRRRAHKQPLFTDSTF